MTDDMKDFDLENLWQSEKGEIDMEVILDTRDRLERGRVMGRRLYNILRTFYVALAVLVIWAEYAEILNTAWVGPVVFVAIGLFSEFDVWRSRKKMPAITTLSPIDLLKNAIERAENNLLLARTLYAVIPVSALIGGLAVPFLVGGTINIDNTAGIPLWAIIAYICLAVGSILTGIVFGLRLAKRKQAELKVLRARLADIAGDTE